MRCRYFDNWSNLGLLGTVRPLTERAIAKQYPLNQEDFLELFSIAYSFARTRFLTLCIL